MLDFKVWEEVEPPPGTVYNYPIRPWHNAAAQPGGGRGGAGNRGADLQPRASTTRCMARLKEGQTIPQVIAWAQDELEGFVR